MNSVRAEALEARLRSAVKIVAGKILASTTEIIFFSSVFLAGYSSSSRGRTLTLALSQRAREIRNRNPKSNNSP
jgi:hypothetical protein